MQAFLNRPKQEAGSEGGGGGGSIDNSPSAIVGRAGTHPSPKSRSSLANSWSCVGEDAPAAARPFSASLSRCVTFLRLSCSFTHFWRICAMTTLCLTAWHRHASFASQIK